MLISPITPYQTKYNHRPSFTSCEQIFNPKNVSNLDIFAQKTVWTISNFFRNDQDWDYLMKYILWNFLNKEKINIRSLACSDGSEPYTYALYLLDKTPETFYKKFTPIMASDINPEMINIAQSGKINLASEDFENIKKYLKNGQLYFRKDYKPLEIKNDWMKKKNAYYVDPELRKMVVFKKSDILTELKNIKDEGNSVINIRNVFPYLKENYIDEVLTTLSQKLKKGSLFVFGHYDHGVPDFRKRLHDLGFFSPDITKNFVQKG